MPPRKQLELNLGWLSFAGGGGRFESDHLVLETESGVPIPFVHQLIDRLRVAQPIADADRDGEVQVQASHATAVDVCL